MTSQTDNCFTRLLLKEYPLITEDTIDCLISNGFKDEELLLVMDVDTDLPILPMAQELALRKILLKLVCMDQKSFDTTLEENLFANVTKIRAQLENNSSATEPLTESSTPHSSPTPPLTTTAIVISSDGSDSLSQQSSSTSLRSLASIPSTSHPSNRWTTRRRRRVLMRTKIRAQKRVTSDCHQTMDIEVEDSYGGHQQTHSLCPRKCSVVLTRVDTTSTGATSRAKTSGNNRKKRFACDWPGCQYNTNWKICLTGHRFTHLSVKPFKCGYNGCHKSYTTKQNLSIHISADHLKVRYHCNYRNCGQSYSYRSDLMRHKKRVHYK